MKNSTHVAGGLGALALGAAAHSPAEVAAAMGSVKDSALEIVSSLGIDAQTALMTGGIGGLVAWISKSYDNKTITTLGLASTVSGLLAGIGGLAAAGAGALTGVGVGKLFDADEEMQKKLGWIGGAAGLSLATWTSIMNGLAVAGTASVGGVTVASAAPWVLAAVGTGLLVKPTAKVLGTTLSGTGNLLGKVNPFRKSTSS